MTGDGQAATRGRPVGGEFGENEIPAWTDRAGCRYCVRLLVCDVSEEVKCGPVMPQRDGVRELNRSDIGANPCHLFSAICEARTELVEGRLGDVDRDDRRVTAVDELSDQR